jgi:hypothetical protein
MTSRIEMTRQELWELVWSMPLSRAAATFPMSHLALKRLCERHQIPLPPLGHWLKSADRQQQDRLPLPIAHLGEQRIWARRFLRRRGPNYRTVAMQPPPAAEVTGEASPFQHQRTRRASAVLEQAKPNGCGAVETNGDGIPSIRVSPAMMPRPLGVLDLLLIAAEGAGYSVSSTDGPATLVVAGERVPSGIIEEIKRKTGRPDGRLTIVLGEMYTGGHRLWTDRPFYPVESRIADIIPEARVHAKAIGERRERREEGVEVRRADEFERMQRRKRVTFMMERADDLDQATKVSRLIEHMRNTGDTSSARLTEILKWADDYVAELRPASSAGAIDHGAAEWGIW